MVFIVGQVDLKVGQVNFAELLARGQVLQKCICQPLSSSFNFMTNLFQNLFQMSGMPIKVVLDTKKKLSPFSEVLQYKPSNYS